VPLIFLGVLCAVALLFGSVSGLLATACSGATLAFFRFECHAHICDAEDDDFHEAYLTIDANRDEDWVCSKCFEMYHLVLKFKVSNPESTGDLA